MDSFKANQLEKILKGKYFKDYKIKKLLNNGKSASVFEGIDGNNYQVAIKIFDNDIIERFGHEIQEQRIEKEISLKGHDIPNLVKILDGGKEKIENAQYYFIIMEFINGKNLKQFISSVNYDNSFLQKITNVLLDVTENLLERNIVHRDIKPENIMVVDTSNEIILMDLGVLKLIGVVSISDMEEKQFVGTLRYAPPEFLMRTEEDTIKGWRAVNLYQIGGVLHDLIMKKELFEGRTTYSNLVLAIKEDAPVISNDNYPFETIQLSRDLLIKNFRTRLEVSSDERIKEFCLKDFNNKTSLEKELESIFYTSIQHKAKEDEIEKIKRSNHEEIVKRNEIANKIEKSIDNCLEKIKVIGLYTKYSKSKNFILHSDQYLTQKNSVKQFLYKIEGELTMGFVRPFFLLVHIVNDENSLTVISISGIFLSKSIKGDIDEPVRLFTEIYEEKNPAPYQTTFKRIQSLYRQNYFITVEKHVAFNGTFEPDIQFEDNLAIKFIKIIKVALKDIEPEVNKEFEIRQRLADNPHQGVVTIGGISKTKFYFEI